MKLQSLITIIRPVNGVMSAIAVYITALVTGTVSLSTLLILPVFLAMLVVFLINSAGMVINDIYDIEIDKINKPKRPLPSGKISIKSAKIYAAILFIIGIGLSWFINIYALGIALLASLLLIAYAAKFKKTLLLGNIIVSILVGLSFIYGGLINMNIIPVLMLALLAFFSNLGREIYKTCEDVLGDKKASVNSIAIKYGVIRAKVLGSIFIALAVVMSIVPFILGILGLSYLVVVVFADIAFALAIISPVAKSSKYVKMAMMIALLSFLIGAIII
ncbi:MAG: UbiA family prenyltransferase [Candidatus Aenigmarchaeota archaeon]|nr:UbiA family prenyltransferase [Candidatus Aenigmarchaeota archaeon]